MASYPLHPPSSTSNSVHSFSTLNSILSIWHQRLGHLATSTLQLIKKFIPFLDSISKFPLCNICNVAQSHHLPFLKSTTCTSLPLQLIHTDVWGPSPIVLFFGFNVSFIDDWSRFVWAFPLRCKSDVTNTFATFKSLVENQLDRKIKILRRDGGGEYYNHIFINLLQKARFQHQISCPHTP